MHTHRAFRSALVGVVAAILLAGNQTAVADTAFTPYIVNGSDTFGYPSVGALATVSGFIPQGGCTGTLIGCQTFLTAAHCVCPEGTFDAASCQMAGGPTPPQKLIVFFQNAGFFGVSRVAINPDYDAGGGGDVALLTLATPVTGISPTRINTTRKPAYGAPGTIVGFGGTGGSDANNAVTAGVKRVGNVTTASCPSDLAVDANHVCFTGVGSTTCHGDSGGPLLVDLGFGPVVAGVDSRGNCINATAETDIFEYASWIQAQAGGDLDNTVCGTIPQAGTNGTQVLGASGELSVQNPVEVHSFATPAGTALLRVALNGESPLAGSSFALLVKAASPPTQAVHDCGYANGTSFAFCEIQNPIGGTWYVTAAWLAGLPIVLGDYQITATLFASNPTNTPTFTIAPTSPPKATRTPTPPAQSTPTPPATVTPTATDTLSPTLRPTPPPTSLPTPTATGESLCSVAGGASPDGKACNTDADCLPNGVCVIAQPVCNGGVDDGSYCGCIGVACVSASPACYPSVSGGSGAGICPSGPNGSECCDVATNCTGGAPCVGAQKVCLAGDFKAVSCLNDGQCPGSVCRSTGKFCSGGDADGYSCVDDGDCVGSPNGTCASAVVSTPTPTPLETAMRTATQPRTPTALRDLGSPCTSGAQCESGFCTDVVCCTDAPCPVVGEKCNIYTLEGMCTLPGNEGDPCNKNPDCNPLLVCDRDNNVCIIPVPTVTPTATAPVGITARLIRAISASDLIIPVDDASLLPTSGIVLIDDELISYLGKTGNVLTGVVRGFPPTTAAPHALGAVVLFVLAATPTPTPEVSCAGDCDSSGDVTVNEIIIMVNIDLGNAPLVACTPGDADHSGDITINEIIGAVNNALGACLLSTPPPNPLYVRASGSDTNSGADPAQALRTIVKAGQLARDGYTVKVGPGTYAGGIALATVGVSPNGIQFVADASGESTGDPAGPVIVDATGSAVGAGFSLSSTADSLIDGFTITGGEDAGIVVTAGNDGGSENFTIRNCIVFANPGDGIRIQDSAKVLIFNNLVYDNGGNGLVFAGSGVGSRRAAVINNTVVANGARGLQVGNSTTASAQGYLRNNIFQGNGGDATIKVFAPPPSSVPRSDVGFDGNFDLVRPPTYLPVTIAGVHDIPDDARFGNGACPGSVYQPACNYHLQANSPAINKGDSLGDLMTVVNGVPVRLHDVLVRRTTTGGNNCDQGVLDLGVHYPTTTGYCTQ